MSRPSTPYGVKLPRIIPLDPLPINNTHNHHSVRKAPNLRGKGDVYSSARIQTSCNWIKVSRNARRWSHLGFTSRKPDGADIQADRWVLLADLWVSYCRLDYMWTCRMAGAMGDEPRVCCSLEMRWEDWGGGDLRSCTWAMNL